FSSLKELHLAYNPFTPGSIPSELGNMSNLEYLWLAHCYLVGQIPESLGRLNKLAYSRAYFLHLQVMYCSCFSIKLLNHTIL
ncbi:hypothetical protein ABU558_26690, partial [Escherichia coli]